MLRAALQGYRRAVRRPGFRRFWLGLLPLLAPPLRAIVEFTGATG